MSPDPLAAFGSAIEQLAKRLKVLESNSRAEVAGGVQALTFAQLPTPGQPGRIVFCTNCRKVGEGAGAGTGCIAYDDGGAFWRRPSDDTPVAV